MVELGKMLEQVHVPARHGRAVEMKKGQKIKVIESEGVAKLTFRFDDSMLALDDPVLFERDGRPFHECSIDRTIATIARTMAERGDPIGMFSAEVTLEIPPKKTSQ